MKTILFFILFIILSGHSHAYTIGVSPSKLELEKGENAQITLFNNNAAAVNYLIESELLKVKKEGQINAFEHKKIIVSGKKKGKEITIVNFDFEGIKQAISLSVEVADKRRKTGLSVMMLTVLIGLISYLLIRNNRLKNPKHYK